MSMEFDDRDRESVIRDFDDRDDEVRLKIGDQVYEVRLERVTDADKLEAVLTPYCDPSNEVVWGLKDEAHTPDPRVIEAARRKIAMAILDASGD